MGFRVEQRNWVEGKKHAVNSLLDSQGPIQGFRTLECQTIHALMRPASEKRQGTKSRWVGPKAWVRLQG
jgi:hypothetical protein